MRARVYVTLKPSVFDPQGRVVADALLSLGYEDVQDVHHRQVVFRYVDDQGQPSAAGHPNGSLNNIAGPRNRGRNVVGLMPHPERACEAALGSDDGRVVLASVGLALAAGGRG